MYTIFIHVYSLTTLCLSVTPTKFVDFIHFAMAECALLSPPHETTDHFMEPAVDIPLKNKDGLVLDVLHSLPMVQQPQLK